jgi:hypothetical protein
VPYRHADAAYLRDKARAFRHLADQLARPLWETVLAIAADLEAKADEIERRPNQRKPD